MTALHKTSHASAPGKFILFGEHAVVYGEPALAAPLQSLRAQASISHRLVESSNSLYLTAEDISLSCHYSDLMPTHPLSATVRGTLEAIGSQRAPRAHLRLRSTIPMAAGLGSSAATSAAAAQALARFLQQELSIEQLSKLVFDVEKLQHGTPSGIDNTVITHEKPMFFRKGQKAEILKLAQPISFVLADSGKRSSTKDTVTAVRRRYEQYPNEYQACFEEMGTIAVTARDALASGESNLLGDLMHRNHVLLQKIGVSSPSLERLVEAALRAGVAGAKLSGAGIGGYIIAHVHPSQSEHVVSALRNAGAKSVTITELTTGNNEN